MKKMKKKVRGLRGMGMKKRLKDKVKGMGMKKKKLRGKNKKHKLD